MATVKSKTHLACDTCRQRKSRCDGIRPSCSHCRVAGRECTYRPTPTNLETDVSVLSRLAGVEARLQAIEGRGRGTPDRGGGSHADGTTTAGPAGSPKPPLLSTAPDLHTASAYKMLHYWPRIRLNLTAPGIVSTSYLAEADAADPVLLQTPTSGPDPPQPPLWQLVRLVEEFYSSSVEKLPVCILEVFDSCPALGVHYVLNGLAQLYPPDAVSQHSATVDLHRLSIAQLLVVSLAKRSSNDSAMQSDSATTAISAVSFTIALQKQWMLMSSSDEERLPLAILAAYCLFYYWARPFHALGLLQSVDPAIKRYSLRHPDDSLVCRYSRLHFILESDILTEIDGFPSKTCVSLLGDHPQSSLPLPASPDNSLTGDQGTSSAVGNYIESHMWLRCYLNRTLHLLYGTNKAYAQPHELADIVCSLSAELRQWYQSRPLGQQFVRDATTLRMNVPPVSPRLREIALRYFSCVFLLHRPVLYFFLHKDMEYTVRPPDNRTLHSDREPWVLESCRDCIESAALLIHFAYIPIELGNNGGVERSYRSWGEVQLLFAAYLVLLQVKSVTALFPIFRNIGDLDELLDRVERVFEALPVESLKVHRSLVILRNERHNFEVSSPGYSIGSV